VGAASLTKKQRAHTVLDGSFSRPHVGHTIGTGYRSPLTHGTPGGATRNGRRRRSGGHVTTIFAYPGDDLLGRQTQTWVRLPEGRRIVTAHVPVPAS